METDENNEKKEREGSKEPGQNGVLEENVEKVIADKEPTKETPKADSGRDSITKELKIPADVVPKPEVSEEEPIVNGEAHLLLDEDLDVS